MSLIIYAFYIMQAFQVFIIRNATELQIIEIRRANFVVHKMHAFRKFTSCVIVDLLQNLLFFIYVTYKLKIKEYKMKIYTQVAVPNQNQLFITEQNERERALSSSCNNPISTVGSQTSNRYRPAMTVSLTLAMRPPEKSAHVRSTKLPTHLALAWRTTSQP